MSSRSDGGAIQGSAFEIRFPPYRLILPSAGKSRKVGDFTNDSLDDLLWRNDNDGTFTLWQSTGNAFTPNVVVGNVGTDWNLITHQYDLV